MKVLILGDLHGDWLATKKVFQYAYRAHRDITHVIQVGDFAYGWPKTRPFAFGRRYFSKDDRSHLRKLPKYFLDGNHENFDLLENDGGAWQPEWAYMSRGSILEIEGKRLLFFGGATSVDKYHRTEGLSWWPQEAITYSQMQETLNRVEGPIDAIFSHEHPSIVPFKNPNKEGGSGQGDRDMLRALWEHCRPDFWFYGHHHDPREEDIRGTNFHCCPIITCFQATFWDGEKAWKEKYDGWTNTAWQ